MRDKIRLNLKLAPYAVLLFLLIFWNEPHPFGDRAALFTLLAAVLLVVWPLFVDWLIPHK